MFKTAAIAIALIIAIVLIYAATRPDTFHTERSININAPPEKIFPFINDFHKWDAWTPYNKDPAMKKTYSDAPKGVGAISAWEGNRDVGKGSIGIIESAPPARIALDLHMIEPFEARNRVEFTLKPRGDSTDVTWAMDGSSSYISKIIGLFINMDNMIGRDFEAGLARLKMVAEQ